VLSEQYCSRVARRHWRGINFTPQTYVNIRSFRGREALTYSRDMSGHIIFKCPYTAIDVQHWLADVPTSAGADDGYETLSCQACTKLHFVNRSSGKLLGEPEQ
jgi:hypothetical protein